MSYPITYSNVGRPTSLVKEKKYEQEEEVKK
jgi:hypothetical protein